MGDEERTEHPTARRLSKAIEDGQVARSTDLSAAAITVGAMALLMYLGRSLFDRVTETFAQGFQFDRKTLDRPEMMITLFADQLLSGLSAIIPIAIFTLIAAVLVNSAMSGLHFSPKAFAPNFSKLSLIKGFARIFGKHALVELGKSLLKFGVVCLILWYAVEYFLTQLLSLGNMALEPALGAAGYMLVRVGLWVSLGLILIALIDVPYQKYTYIKGLKMTKQEVKDEMKNIEGNPEIKMQIRRRQREMANSRMIQRVKDADVIITNPEHFAVALEYDPTSDGAPILVAKGCDHMAARIREEAELHGIHIFQAPPLARALYFTTEPEQQVPEELYQAVAQVIAYVFSLEAASPHHPSRPKPQVKVPPGMRFNTDGKRVTTDGALA